MADARAESAPSLADLRDAINTVDGQLLALLNKRAALSLDVGQAKRATGEGEQDVFRPGREASMMHELMTQNPGPLPNDHLLAIYREILSSSRHLQRPQRVAFLGPEGTFSHIAGLDLLGSLPSFHPQGTLADVFAAVEEEDCDIGIVPLENSLQGSVGQSFDLFFRHQLYICAETFHRIRHSLLSPEKELASIKTVYSHPQPLAQCGAWLRTHLPRATVIPMESTAAAAHHVLEEPGSAAIAHEKLAGTLGLHILAHGMEDQPGNWTRFVVIGRRPADRPGTNKTSILFSVSDKPGSLAAVLSCFSGAKVNMRKLESRPMPGASWKYIFFADLECDLLEDAYAPVLQEMHKHCHSVRVLGSYPAGKQE